MEKLFDKCAKAFRRMCQTYVLTGKHLVIYDETFRYPLNGCICLLDYEPSISFGRNCYRQFHFAVTIQRVGFCLAFLFPDHGLLF